MADRERRADPSELIAMLGLAPHPEGGWYAETWREPAPAGARPAGSAIQFLLRAGERSRWHRVDATEIWHHYAGDPLLLEIAPEGGPATAIRLRDDVVGGERPQAVVPAGAWQTARSLGAWTLVGCTVAPAFRFEGFELAPEGWVPREAAEAASAGERGSGAGPGSGPEAGPASEDGPQPSFQ